MDFCTYKERTMSLLHRQPYHVLALALCVGLTPCASFAQDEPLATPVIIKSGIFVPPTGLTKPVNDLLIELGYLDGITPITSIPYSHNFCMEVAIKCHVQGRYIDSLAFVMRATEIRTTHAALFLRALNQIALNRDDDVATSVSQFNGLRTTGTDITWLREKLSSPLTVRLKALFEAIAELPQ
jgi:hypothetical protein